MPISEGTHSVVLKCYDFGHHVGEYPDQSGVYTHFGPSASLWPLLLSVPDVLCGKDTMFPVSNAPTASIRSKGKYDKTDEQLLIIDIYLVESPRPSFGLTSIL